MSTELNDKQKRFCQEYMIDMNGKQAAIRAGYTARSAEVTASRMLRNDKVQQYLNELREQLANKLEITQQTVLRELGRVGFQDVRKYYDTEGKLIPIHKLDDDAAAAIAGIETDEHFALDSKQGPVEINEQGELVSDEAPKFKLIITKKIKRYDKVKALEAINKMMGWNAAEKIEHEVGGSFLELLKQTSVNRGVEQQKSKPKSKAKKQKRRSGRSK